MRTINAREIAAGDAVSLESLLKVPMVAENDDDIRERINSLLMEGDRYVIVNAAEVCDSNPSDAFVSLTIDALDSEYCMSVGTEEQVNVAG